MHTASALVLISNTTTVNTQGLYKSNSCQRNPIVLFANLQNQWLRGMQLQDKHELRKREIDLYKSQNRKARKRKIGEDLGRKEGKQPDNEIN